jgi:hypothetical protein
MPRKRQPSPEIVAASPLPNPETVKAAIPILQAELSLASSNLDGIDRKAALLPPVVIGLGGLLLPDGPWTGPQTALIGLALVAGVVSVGLVLRVVLPGEWSLGPNAEQVTRGLTMPPADFELRVAGSLAKAVQRSSSASAVKGRSLRRATYWAVAATLLLIAAQVVGGLPLTDQQNPGAAAPSAAPSSAAPSPSASPSESPTVAPTAPPATSEVGGSFTAEVVLPDFGEQIMERGGLPDFGEQLAAKGGNIPSEIERRIIEKGG